MNCVVIRQMQLIELILKLPGRSYLELLFARWGALSTLIPFLINQFFNMGIYLANVRLLGKKLIRPNLLAQLSCFSIGKG